MQVLSARDLEEALVARCAEAAEGMLATAADQREANVFRLAAMIVGPRHEAQAQALSGASEEYFRAHPDERLDTTEVLRRSWIASLPRLREALTRKIEQLPCTR
jgi:hypothetical protein